MATIPFLDRALPGRVGARRFSAIAGPHGIHAVEYGRERGGLAVHGGIRQELDEPDAWSLAEGLADAVEALGGRGGELSLALGGFGTAHHVLTLPVAEESVLQPIVRRELLRYYPGLDDPEVDYVPGAPVPGEPPKREVVVGAVPRSVAATLSHELADRGIILRHLTVLPRVLQNLHDVFVGSPGPSVMVVLMETGLLVGCFHEGALRLFIEPPQDLHGRPLRELEAVTEQVDRARLFLRQQFPAASPARILLAAPEDQQATVEARLRSALKTDVTPLANGAAGSLAALGAALDAASAGPLQLLPAALRPRSRSEQWTRRLGATAAAVAVAAAVWWAGAGIALARSQADRAGALEAGVLARAEWVRGTERLLEARRSHDRRLAFLEATAADRSQVRRIMAAVAAAASPRIRLDRMTVERTDGAWTLSLAGRAEGGSAAEAVRAVDSLHRGIPARLPARELALGELRDLREEEGDAGDGVAGAPVAIAFDMSFIVQWQTDLGR